MFCAMYTCHGNNNATNPLHVTNELLAEPLGRRRSGNKRVYFGCKVVDFVCVVCVSGDGGGCNWQNKQPLCSLLYMY